MVAITDYRKLVGLKQYTFILTVLEVRHLKSVSLGWNQGVGRAILPMVALGENPFPGLFQPFRTVDFAFLAFWHFVHFQSQQHGILL